MKTMDIIKGSIALAVTALTLMGCCDGKDISAVEHIQNVFEDLLCGYYFMLLWLYTAV